MDKPNNSMEDPAASGQWGKRISGFFQSASYIRLKSSIGPLEKELEMLEKNTTEDLKKHWINNAQRNLIQSKEYLSNYELQPAWKHFHRAVCATAYLLDDESLRNKANVTLIESKKKLDGWRRDAVVNVLTDSKGNLKNVKNSKVDKSSSNEELLTNNDLCVALNILTEEYNNRYIKNEIAHKQLILLILSSIVLIPLGILMLAFSPLKFEISNFSFLASVVVFGAIGGTISGLITVSRGGTRKKIPDQILNSWSTMSKPIFGAISALAVSVFIFAGLVTTGGAVSNSLSIYLILAVSVLSGFSERFLLNVLRDNDIQRTQKDIVEKLDEVTDKIKKMTPSTNEENKKN